jgi:hypothetical protein
MKRDDLLKERKGFALGSLDYIRQEFPALADRTPAKLKPFSRGFGVGDGMATHPAVVKDDWLYYRGGEAFALDEGVSDGFHCFGLKNAGGSEYVFAMWRRGRRRFWFQAQYVNFHVGNYYEEVREQIAHALRLWDAGRMLVAFCGSTDISGRVPRRRKARPE